MKFDKQRGYVVIPTNATGAPLGIALWCATPEQCEEVFNQEHGGEGNAYLVSCWISSEAHAKTEPVPALKPSPKPRLVKAGPRHRVEDE